MASYKGKTCVIDEEDDDPIHISDQADENLIREYCLSLIGKILNPQNQNGPQLIIVMPEKWGMSEKITSCDLGNGRFLFNFYSEEDLNAVLSFGPFHHNDCMFVLGIALHLCTELKLQVFYIHLESFRAFTGSGTHLCKMVILEHFEALMEPLRKTRRQRVTTYYSLFTMLQTRNGEDIIIKLHYDMLFKNCSLCGLMTHEAADCLKMTVPAPVLNYYFRDSAIKRWLPIGATVFDRIKVANTIPIERSLHKNQRGSSKDCSKCILEGSSSMSYNDRSSYQGRIGSDNAKVSGSGSGTGVSSGVARMAVKQNPNPLIPPISQSFEANILIEARTQTIDSNVTFRPEVKEKQIRALYEDDPVEEDEIQDDFAGNELMGVEEDDLLGEYLMQMDYQSNNRLALLNVPHETLQPNTILMIETKPEGDKAEWGHKDLARSVARFLFQEISSQTQANGAGRGRLAQQGVATRKKKHLNYSEERSGGCQTSAPLSSRKTPSWNCRMIENISTVRYHT
ncbi:hypothetical protein N665_1040s0002 [Sinapis alba]|nr:hypothetical protein N665_1040s0002 [Sinapis alba]